MFDTSACVDLIFLFVTQVDLEGEGEGGRTTLYFLLLYLKVSPLSLSVSISPSVRLSVCLSVCLSVSLPHFFPPCLLFFKLIFSDLHSTVEWYLFALLDQRFHQKITLFLFFYSLVYCNFLCVWNYCVPIYACCLFMAVLFVRLPVFWLYYIGHGLCIYVCTCIFSAGFSVLWSVRLYVMCLYWLRFWTVCMDTCGRFLWAMFARESGSFHDAFALLDSHIPYTYCRIPTLIQN